MSPTIHGNHWGISEELRRPLLNSWRRRYVAPYVIVLMGWLDICYYKKNFSVGSTCCQTLRKVKKKSCAQSTVQIHYWSLADRHKSKVPFNWCNPLEDVKKNIDKKVSVESRKMIRNFVIKFYEYFVELPSDMLLHNIPGLLLYHFCDSFCIFNQSTPARPDVSSSVKKVTTSSKTLGGSTITKTVTTTTSKVIMAFSLTKVLWSCDQLNVFRIAYGVGSKA